MLTEMRNMCKYTKVICTARHNVSFFTKKSRCQLDFSTQANIEKLQGLFTLTGRKSEMAGKSVNLQWCNLHGTQTDVSLMDVKYIYRYISPNRAAFCSVARRPFSFVLPLHPSRRNAILGIGKENPPTSIY